jgi:hypothetical protein
MVEDQLSIASFVVRFTQHLWEGQQEEPHVQWHGQIRHVQSDQEIYFSDLGEALAFIRNHLAQLTLDATQGKAESEQKKFLSESLKLWDELASSYSKMASEALLLAIKQSGSLTAEVDAAVSRGLQAWRSSSELERASITRAVENINAQVIALAEKIDRLAEEMQ